MRLNMENWINVCEYNRKEEESIEWLFKILDEEKIPYKQETKENWFGYRMPTYQENIVVYVPTEYKEKVESYLKEYNNPNNIVYEDVEELRNVSNYEEDEQLKEIKRGQIAKKMLAWIPIGMVLIVIIGGIISSIIY